MEREFYKLDDFFKYIVNIFSKRDSKKYTELVNEYKNKIISSPKPKLNIIENEIYMRDIIFREVENNYYKAVWEIKKARKVIKSENIRLQKIPIANVISLVDTENLDPNNLKVALNNNNPIILVEFNPLNDYFIIDGNHRVYSKFINKKQDYVTGYVLDTEQSMKAMPGELFVNLFKTHYNITKLYNDEPEKILLI